MTITRRILVLVFFLISGIALTVSQASTPNPPAHAGGTDNWASVATLTGTQLQIVGPVALTIRNGTNINGSIGNPNNPLWLTLNVSNGGVTLNGGSQMFGKVNAPSGSVTVNSRLTGNVICDRLTINGGGVVTSST